MKKSITLIFLLMIINPAFAKKISELKPTIGETFDFSEERQKFWSKCEALMYPSPTTDKLTQEEKFKLLNSCEEIGYSEACDGIWGIVCGDDWTDEGYNFAYVVDEKGNRLPNYEFTTASSSLKSQKNNDYRAKNISDLNYRTAWIEGAKGYGIGENVTFKFPSSHPRITTVIIVNGYVKSKAIWKDNSRVKRLKMYLNNKPFAILNLKDVYAEQTFKIPTIGYEKTYHAKNDGGYYFSYKNRKGKKIDNYNNKFKPPKDNIRFEILSVYKGDKYKDTALSEIYFSGLDVY